MLMEFEKEPETYETTYNRFLANYLRLAGPGADMNWFEANLEPLLHIAAPGWRRPKVANRWPGRNSLISKDQLIDYYSPAASVA